MGSPVATYASISSSESVRNRTAVASAATSVRSAVTSGHARDHAMRAAGQQAQHARGVGCVLRLAQNCVVERDGGIGAQHDKGDWPPAFCASARCLPQSVLENGLGLFSSQPRDVGNGIFARQRILGNVRRANLEVVAHLREQFTAARRGGG